jgi:L-seryl-tRNA(Ser) seleniumtransferase
MAVDARRTLPSVDALLRSGPGVRAARAVGRAPLKLAILRTLDEVRAEVAAGAEPPIADEILARAAGRASRVANGLTRVINATGVILHTNLGRAPLGPHARDAVARAAAGYADLEVDRESGTRGKRSTRAETLLTSLTGAEDALVVNNCAAALLLSLTSLAKGKQVLVSRGELIEIGGEFRIPDIMAASGAKLVEVGTTNRTRIGDYRAAAAEATRLGAILKVHPSNYRLVGFTASPSAKDLGGLARRAGVPFLYDVGSGLLEQDRGLPEDEPTVREALEHADLVTFSGDKLLGGPQAGCIVGRADLIARLRRHPVARAVRVDKLQIAALEATLMRYALGERKAIPVARMLHESAETVARRAHAISEAIGGDLEGAHVVKTSASVGGGSMPGVSLPSSAVRMTVPDGPAFAARLRTGTPSVFCRIDGDRVLIDCRTVDDDEIHDLVRAVQYAIEGDDLDEE